MGENNVKNSKKKMDTSQTGSLKNTKISSLQELREDDFPINDELIDAKKSKSNNKKDEDLMKEDNKKANNLENDLLKKEELDSNSKKTTVKKEKKSKTEPKFQKIEIESEVTDPKNFFEFNEKAPKFKNEDGKTAINNLQKLREQIQAQKKLERKIMESEAVKTQSKDKELLTKLSQLESLVEVEKADEVSEDLILLEQENEELNKKIKELNDNFNKLLNLKYNDLPVIDKDTLDFNSIIIDKASNHDDINEEINRLEHELEELNNSHTNNIQEVLIANKDEIDNLNKKIEDLNRQLKKAKSQLSKEKKTNKELSEKFNNEEFTGVSDEKLEQLKVQLEELMSKNKEANKELSALKKLDVESLKADRNELLKQTRSLNKQVDNLNEKLLIMAEKAKEEKLKLNEELKATKKELRKFVSKSSKLEEKVNVSKGALKEMKAEVVKLNKEVLLLDEVKNTLDSQIGTNKDLETRNTELENLMNKNDLLVAEFKEQLKITRSDLKKANNAKKRLENKVKDLQSNITDKDTLQKEIEAKDNEIENLNNKIIDLGEQINSLEIDKKKIDELNAVNSELINNNDKLKSLLSEKDVQLNSSLLEKNELLLSVNNKEQDIKNLELKLEELNNKINEITESSLNVDEKEALIIKLENQNTDLIAELDLKNDEIDELNEKIQGLEIEIKEKTSSSKNASILSTTVDELQEKLNNLVDEHSDLVNSYETKLDEISDLKEKIEEYEFQIQDLKNSAEVKPELDTEHLDTIETLKSDIETLKSDIETKSYEIIDLKAIIESLELDKKDLKELGNDNLILKSQVKDLESRLLSKNDDIKALESKISSLYEKLNNKENEYRIGLTEKEEQLEAVNLENKDLLDKLNNFNDKYVASSDEYNSLIAKVEELSKELNLQKDKYNSEIEEIEARNQRNQRELNEFNKTNIDRISILERNLSNAISDKNDFIIELERTKKMLSEEKFNHHDEISRLKRDLDHKTDEIERLKQEISNASQRRLDSTINNLVNELERKTSYGFHQMNPMMYPNLYNNDKLQKDYEKELQSKDTKIKELEDKQLEIENNMKDKILLLENQLRGIESLIKSSSKEENDNVYQDNLKALKQELEDYKKEIKEDVERQIESRTNIYMGSDNVQNIIKKYTSEKELITYKFNSELNRLEAQKKFTDIPAEMAIINEKISHLKNEYKKLLDENDYRFRNEIIKNSKELYDEVDVEAQEDFNLETSEPNESDIPDYVGEFEDYKLNLLKNDDYPINDMSSEKFDVDNSSTEYHESDIPEMQGVNKVIDIDDDDLYEDTLPDFENLVETTDNLKVESSDKNKNSTIVYSRTREEDGDFRIVGKVGQDYLLRISNNRKLRANLQEKQRDEISKYNNEYKNNIKLQEELQSKIVLVKSSIESLEEKYNSSKYHSPEQTKDYESEKTKLYFELENRQEKLRKHKEEDIRKLELRHKNIMMNLSEQIAQLDAEEKALKEAYLSKKQKDLSKQNRDNELLAKLEEERKALDKSREELDVEQVVDNKPSESLKDRRVIVSKDEKRKSLLSNLSDQEVELSNKEKELISLFKKYQAAEAKMKSEISEVKLYSDNLLELNGFKVIYEKNLAEMEELKSQLSKDANNNNLNARINELAIKSNNLKNKIDYRNHQLEGLKSNKVIGEYIKLSSKLDDIKKLLVKHSMKRKV